MNDSRIVPASRVKLVSDIRLMGLKNSQYISCIQWHTPRYFEARLQEPRIKRLRRHKLRPYDLWAKDRCGVGVHQTFCFSFSVSVRVASKKLS